MKYDTLRRLCERNEVRIDDHGGHTRTPPYYYDSLRHAFEAYFKTFQTKNAVYHWYAEGLTNRNIHTLRGQYLDEENTVLALVSFARFFELLLKDLLGRANRNLMYSASSRGVTLEKLLESIHSRSFVPGKYAGKPLTVPFRETISRFFGLAKLCQTDPQTPLKKKFARLLKTYGFLNSRDVETSFKILSWYRDRILHNGNRLPSPWLLDYFVTQHLVPLVSEIIRVEREKVNGFTNLLFITVSGINVLERLNSVQFEFKDLSNSNLSEDVFVQLLYIGHLKEMGRANLNMNLFVRHNRASHEYNYRDPIGRGKRFAEAEKVGHPNAEEIKSCPCCGVESMVKYREVIDDFFNPGTELHITWVKCYTCEYHLRFNVSDPKYFDLHSELLFHIDSI